MVELYGGLRRKRSLGRRRWKTTEQPSAGRTFHAQNPLLAFCHVKSLNILLLMYFLSRAPFRQQGEAYFGDVECHDARLA